MIAGLAPLLAACTVGGVPAQCGTIGVPESYADPAGKQIALNVAVLPAANPRAARADPVFFIAGGPGGAAVELLAGAAHTYAAINERRDLVFVDQRGVGGSSPLSCTVATETTSAAAVVSACLGVATGDVLHYRTGDAMDDLDAVRQALGYATIDVFGGSYGATAAQVYLRRHPATVRTLIIEAATLLDVPVFERWSSNGQRALKLLANRCRADRDCRTVNGRWYDRFPALLAKLAKKPVRVGRTTVDAASTAAAVETMTANVGNAVRVPFALARAEAGKYAPLAREIGYTALLDQTIQLMPVTIRCTEPWAAYDPAAVFADAKETYLSYFQPADAVAWKQVCDAWPNVDAAAEDWTRVRSDVPALVLVGGADPKDPPANTVGVEQVMPNAAVVTVPGGAHGVSHLGCLPQLLDTFLERGSASGLDVSCAKRALVPYPSFRTS